MDISAKLAQANGRLRASKVGIIIEQRLDRLALRGTFPPRSGSKKIKPFQQRLSLGCHATPLGVKEAEAEARKIGALLDCKEFDWTPYLKLKEPEARTIGYWVEQFESDFFAQGGSETTWNGEYRKIFKKLPHDRAITPELLETTIRGTDPNTRTRKRACMALKLLAEKAGLSFDPSPLAGNYSPRRVQPRDLPSDEAIAIWQSKIKNPGWKWVYGILAAYGLRPHEAFRLDLTEFTRANPIIQVTEATKTGSRRVWPCFPEWFEEWQLWNQALPNIDLLRTNEKVGHSATEYFGDFGLPFGLYDLRHAWAVRTLECGIPSELAAAQMGHSVAVHNDLYHRWISDRHHNRAFEMMKNHPDRPRAPKIIGAGSDMP